MNNRLRDTNTAQSTTDSTSNNVRHVVQYTWVQKWLRIMISLSGFIIIQNPDNRKVRPTCMDERKADKTLPTACRKKQIHVMIYHSPVTVQTVAVLLPGRAHRVDRMMQLIPDVSKTTSRFVLAVLHRKNVRICSKFLAQ